MRSDFDIRTNFSKGTMPPRNKKNFRPTSKGAGMPEAGVKVGNKSYKKYYSNPGFKMPKIS